MELIELKLPLLTTANYGVVMGIGLAVCGKGIKWVIIKMQGLTVVEDFLPLSLGSTYVILGMQWLGTLGTMEVNWQQLIMKFKMGETLMILKGDPSLCKSGVSLKVIMKELQQQGQGVLVEMCYLRAEEKKELCTPGISSWVEELKKDHPKVFFRAPTSSRGRPCYLFGSGTALVNVRPFQYPHFQKSEIKRLVREMCAAGII